MMLHVCLITALLLPAAGDLYYCDNDIADPLDSYRYTCDSVAQCVDGSDELGCTSCPSGSLLLLGISPDSALFQYETIFVKQTFTLKNRAVYKTSASSPRAGYITYNYTDETWVISEEVDRGRLLVSQRTVYGDPALSGITWRSADDGSTLPDVRLHCVTSDSYSRCYGNLLLVAPDTVAVLEATGEVSNSRPVYENEDFVLQYVTSSNEWGSPHWQVANTTGDEVAVFLGSVAIYPEHVHTPGLYRQESGAWSKSSNVYFTCQILTNVTTHPLDCIFQDGICAWSSRGALTASLGSAEQFSVGQRLPPSLYLTADQYTGSGKYKLVSSTFTLAQESCLLLKLANTVYIAGEDASNLTVTVQDLYSTTTAWSMTKCTDCPNNVTCNCDQITYSTQKISLSPATDAQVTISLELGDNAQYSGIISLAETALVQSPCDDVELDWVDGCYDFDFPCDYHTCVKSGLLGYECKCSDDQYGASCQSALNCSAEDFSPPEHVHTNKTVVFSSHVYLECSEGYHLLGDLPRCSTNGTWSPSPTCAELACPSLHLDHGNYSSHGLQANFTCDPGFLLTSQEPLECIRGTWSSSPPACLLDCSFSSSSSDETSETSSLALELLICDYSSSSQVSNFTNCLRDNTTLDEVGSWEVSSDLHISLDSKGKLCVRYADIESQTISCKQTCISSVLLKLVRTVDDTQQFVEVTTNFDYSTTEPVISSGHAVAYYRTVLILICIRLMLFSFT